MPAKGVTFDGATWQALDLLARDRMADFQLGPFRISSTDWASIGGMGGLSSSVSGFAMTMSDGVH